MNSLTLCTGNELCTTSISGIEAISVIGTKSFTGSYGCFCRLALIAKAIVVTSSVWPSGAALATWVGADRAAAAGPVVDDGRLAPVVGQALRDQPGDRVGGAAGDERHHQLDRMIGIGSLPRRRAAVAKSASASAIARI